MLELLIDPIVSLWGEYRYDCVVMIVWVLAHPPSNNRQYRPGERVICICYPMLNVRGVVRVCVLLSMCVCVCVG